ncbi:GNAT family N-acetyltransferase [Myxococcota bacterium]
MTNPKKEGSGLIPGWQGEKVRLVPIDKEKHLDNVIRWLNDPDVTHWLIIGTMPVTKLAEEAFFDQMATSQDKDILFAVETLDGQHVGITGLHQIDWIHSVATTGTVIGEKALWRKGLGTDTAITRSCYAFDVLNLRLLMVEVIDGNEASLKMLKNLGYRETGRIPQRYWQRGEYCDAIQLVLSRDEWSKRTSRS